MPPGGGSGGANDALKAEIRAFGTELWNELTCCPWEAGGSGLGGTSLKQVLERLWERGSVGPEMRRRPEVGAKYMRRWAAGKVGTRGPEQLMSCGSIKPSRDGAEYDERVKGLLRFAVVNLFAAMSESYFANGAKVIGQPGEVLQQFKRCLGRDAEGGGKEGSKEDGEGATELDYNEMNGDVELFAPETVQLPSFSQDSMPTTPLTPAGRRTRYSSFSQHSLSAFATEPEVSLSRLDSWGSGRGAAWPIHSLYNTDPATDAVQLTAGWLRMCMIALDLHPDAHRIDTFEEGVHTSSEKSAPGENRRPRAYPFEQKISDIVVSAFVLCLPVTLKEVYRELEVSPSTSEVLTAALKLRQVLSKPGEVWPDAASSEVCSSSGPLLGVLPPNKKRRRDDKAREKPASDRRKLVQQELQSISDRARKGSQKVGGVRLELRRKPEATSVGIRRV